MKKQFLIIGALGLFSFTQAQDISQSQVPSLVLNQFSSQFPKATDVEWEMDGNLYNVEFELGWNIDREVWYNPEGKIVKHKEDISRDKLPEAVNNRIKVDFSDYTIDDLEQITDNGRVIYKMELNSLLQQDWDVIIDATGKVISKIED